MAKRGSADLDRNRWRRAIELNNQRGNCCGGEAMMSLTEPPDVDEAALVAAAAVTSSGLRPACQTTGEAPR